MQESPFLARYFDIFYFGSFALWGVLRGERFVRTPACLALYDRRASVLTIFRQSERQDSDDSGFHSLYIYFSWHTATRMLQYLSDSRFPLLTRFVVKLDLSSGTA